MTKPETRHYSVQDHKRTPLKVGEVNKDGSCNLEKI